MEFRLHERLKSDLVELADWELCKIMQLPDSENPWIVLVPRVPGIVEWHQLTHDQQVQLTREISKASELLENEFRPDKINVGALGNMVPQLHVHVICRYKDDRAWPGAIWGTSGADNPEFLSEVSERLKNLLQTKK